MIYLLLLAAVTELLVLVTQDRIPGSSAAEPPQLICIPPSASATAAAALAGRFTAEERAAKQTRPARPRAAAPPGDLHRGGAEGGVGPVRSGRRSPQFEGAEARSLIFLPWEVGGGGATALLLSDDGDRSNRPPMYVCDRSSAGSSPAWTFRRP